MGRYFATVRPKVSSLISVLYDTLQGQQLRFDITFIHNLEDCLWNGPFRLARFAGIIGDFGIAQRTGIASRNGRTETRRNKTDAAAANISLSQMQDLRRAGSMEASAKAGGEPAGRRFEERTPSMRVSRNVGVGLRAR